MRRVLAYVYAPFLFLYNQTWVRFVVFPRESKRRLVLWRAFCSAHKADIKHWHKVYGGITNLPVIWDGKEYRWVNRSKRRELGRCQ